MNGFKKIGKWLRQRGYSAIYDGTDYYRHNDSFHKGELYQIEKYLISNGLYVLVKVEGKPRYILSKSDTLSGHVLIDFSQEHFVKRLEESGHFPIIQESSV